jgi:hypothetical protein
MGSMPKQIIQNDQPIMLISSTQPRGQEAPPIASAAVRRTNQVAYWLLSPILTRIIAYCGGANFEPPTTILFHPRLSTPIRVNPCTIPLTGKIDVFLLRGRKPNSLGVARRYNPNPNASS